MAQTKKEACMAKQPQLKRTGIYLRLSRDDEKAGESLSIENQRNILHKFADENGGCVVNEYVDDGFSGTDFERPAIKRLLDDAKDGKIDTILVKDRRPIHRLYLPCLWNTIYRPFGQRGYRRTQQRGHGHDADHEYF